MIFVLNCGSQSIKWKIFTKDLKLEKEGSVCVPHPSQFEEILESELKKTGNPDIKIIGHRVVHGGTKFRAPVRITRENIGELEKLCRFAPLHNPYNIKGIEECQKIFVNIPQFAVFDTEFFADLPEKAYLYALPEKITDEFGYRRYGFQGTSHEFVAKKASEKLGRPFNELKIITCHLGGGASLAAIKNGKAIDTSMGFTPLEGLMMTTRTGNVDPGIVLDLAKHFTISRVEDILNKESGLKGICGAGEMLSVLKLVDEKNKKAVLALDMFVYSIQKYIGAYYAVLGGCDAVVFTGSIGSGSEKIREMICGDLEILKNTEILTIKTDEELAIAEKISKL